MRLGEELGEKLRAHYWSRPWPCGFMAILFHVRLVFASYTYREQLS